MATPPLCPTCGQPASEALAGREHDWECRNEACPEFGQPVSADEPELDAVAEQPYFDQSGEASDAPGRFVRVEDLDPLIVLPGLEFRPVTTDTVMTNFVTFEPNADAPVHHHTEQQIAIVLAGELTFTVGGETRVMHAGDCVVIPPNVEHGGFAGPEGCRALDVFTPPRAGIVQLMSS